MKQMFDISEKLIVGQSDEIYGVTPMNCEDPSWKQLSLVGDEEVISLSHAKVLCILRKSSVSRTGRFCVFSDSVLCLGQMHQNPQSNLVWEDKLTWFKSSSQYRTLDTIDGEPMEFEWNISQDSPHCSSATKSKSSCQKTSDKPEEFEGRDIFVSMSNDIS